jgi:outer membrane protein OmpA-like peptidoglycan-associated protein
MKSFISLLVLTAALLPGCGKKKVKEQKPKSDEKSVNIPLAKNGAQRGFFDENIDGFVLEGDAIAQGAIGDAKDESLLASADTKGFKTIYFQFDKYNVNKDQELVLESDAKEAVKVAKDEDKTVVVEGHSCHSAGSKTYNLILSEHRAQEVAKRLEEAGVPQDHIKAVGRGTEMPAVMGGSREEQAPNRRVEIFPLQS